MPRLDVTSLLEQVGITRLAAFALLAQLLCELVDLVLELALRLELRAALLLQLGGAQRKLLGPLAQRAVLRKGSLMLRLELARACLVRGDRLCAEGELKP